MVFTYLAAHDLLFRGLDVDVIHTMCKLFYVVTVIGSMMLGATNSRVCDAARATYSDRTCARELAP